MKRLLLTLLVSFLCVQNGFQAAYADEWDDLKTKITAITETPFTGTVEEYPAYANRLGDEILALVDPLFSTPDLSPENKKYLVDMKRLGLLLRYGFDDADYEKKYEAFLEQAQDYELYRQWIGRNFDTDYVWKSELTNEEKQKRFSKELDRFAPLINKYFNDEKRISNQQLPSITVGMAEHIDPDGSLGLVREAVEKLRPILEADAKREKYDLLGSCARGALNSIRRLDMVGKPMEFKSIDLDDKPIDLNDLKGKVVLLIAAPYQWDEKKLVSLREIYTILKSHGFEILLFCQDNPEISKQKLQSQGETWIMTPRSHHETDYFTEFGSHTFAFLVDREGKVVFARTDGITPELFEGMKPLFPEQTDAIAKAVEQSRSLQEELKKKSDEQTKVWLGTTEEKLSDPLQKLVTFQGKIYDAAPPQMRLTLTDLILSSDDLPEANRPRLLRTKVDIMGDLARETVRKNPDTRPEIFYEEINALADELLETLPPIFHANLYYAKQEGLYQMREYLKKMESGQKEYAEEITRRYLDITKHAPEGFYHNSSMFAMFYQRDLEEIDEKQSTQLTKSFLEQVMPIFAASPSREYQQEARRMEGMLRRHSLIGSELEFETLLLDGSKINVKDLQGKVVVVNFWNTQCGPCLREFPHMKTMYEKFKPQGYEMIAYSCGDDNESLKAFVEKTRYPWLTGSLVMSTAAGLTDYNDFYGITGVPTTMILDRSGVVRFMMVGSDDDIFTKELEKRFAEEPAE